MSSLKELRGRIKSVKSTEKITKAMKIVAAARLRGARNKLESAEAYSSSMSALMHNITASIAGLNSEFPLLTGNGKEKTYLLVIFSSERGLCGPLNSNLGKFVDGKISELSAAGKEVKLLCIGKKGFDYCLRNYNDKIIDKIIISAKDGYSFNTAVNIAEQLILLFEDNKFDICCLLYNQFISVMSQQQCQRNLIPLEEESAGEANNAISDFTYEPNKSAILTELIPKNIAVQIYRVLLETNACELGARMTAMDSAMRNAEKLIKELSLQYNRSRQMQITNELIEIISGAEAA